MLASLAVEYIQLFAPKESLRYKFLYGKQSHREFSIFNNYRIPMGCHSLGIDKIHYGVYCLMITCIQVLPFTSDRYTMGRRSLIKQNCTHILCYKKVARKKKG